MLLARISKALFNSLPPEVQEHYASKGEEYVLDIKGDTPEMETLRNQASTALNAQLKAETRAQAAEAKIATAEQTAEAKYSADLKAANERVSKMQETALTARKTAIVNEIASKFKNPELFAPAIESRVKLEYNEKGELVETFMNEKGEAVTLEQLSDSYCKNPAYSAMLTQPQSSVTLPTNQQPQQQPNQFGAPQFNNGGTTVGSTQTQPSANWGLDASGKPVVYNWGKMTDAETKAYAEAMHPSAATGNA